MEEEPIVGATYTRTYIYHNDDHQLREYTDEVYVVRRVDTLTWKFLVEKPPEFERALWKKIMSKGQYTYDISITEFPVLALGDAISNSEPSFIHFIIYKLKDHETC
jgi:hypothetical protein